MSANSEGYTIASHVAVSQREALEQLLFFNPAQRLAHDSIVDEIARCGQPRIVETKAGLTVQVGGVGSQVLFAFSRTKNVNAPIGLLVFCRESHEELSIVHLAVTPQHSLGKTRCKRAALVLVDEVRRIASAVVGIQRIKLSYRNLSFQRIRL